MEAAIVASCQVYESTPGIIGPGSRVIHGDYSTDVGVAWDAANTTALIAFRGSQVNFLHNSLESGTWQFAVVSQLQGWVGAG